jgi:ATP-binding cassette subfamily F protein 3
VKDLEAQLADDKLYSDSVKATQVSDAYQLKKLELQGTQAKWESLAEQILELES